MRNFAFRGYGECEANRPSFVLYLSGLLAWPKLNGYNNTRLYAYSKLYKCYDSGRPTRSNIEHETRNFAILTVLTV